MMRRREFTTLLGGAAVAWPLAARAQQPRGKRRIGLMMVNAESDTDGQIRVAVFRQGLEELGWTESRNIRIDYRWGAGDPDRARAYAAELLAQVPDAILANGTPAVTALQRATRSVLAVPRLMTRHVERRDSAEP
jgi:putative ABC transport system substrate-binding protein